MTALPYKIPADVLCDWIEVEDLSNQLPCFNPETKVIQYRDRIRGIDIYITFNTLTGIYIAYFQKENQIFSPKENPFEAKTWEPLSERIQTEMRNQEFIDFIGVTNRKIVLSAFQSHSSPIFSLEQ
jgi:hypothetical protein